MLTGSSTSWMMENRAELMIDASYDYGFSATLMRKDIGLVLEDEIAMPRESSSAFARMQNGHQSAE